jgi:Asp-tRNA(Asn)/Glu-tRNA(Gln) amidotransferase A subunit family amidase
MQDGRDLTRRDVLAAGAAGATAAALTPTAEATAAPVKPALGGGADELAWTPAWKIKEMFKARKLSPLEYAKSLLARVERNKRLGAFITVFPELLLEQARAATDDPGDGLLAGLPVSVKDTVFTKGQRTTLGSLLFKDHVPDKDSVASEQIKKHGGIIFAKTNTPEFALNRRSLNMVSREAVNPWDTTRTSGGSSGGAGVACAAGLGPLALGTDGGGSIRLPSAFNGTFGLCASVGRIPNGAGYFSTPSGRFGPMTRDVRDAALLLQAVAVIDPRDPFSALRQPAPDYFADLEKGVKGVRIAWSPDYGHITPGEPEIVPICHEAALSFRAMGANYSEPYVRIEDVHDPLEPDHEYSPAQVAARVLAIKPDWIDPLSWSMKQPPAERAKLSVYLRDRTDHPTELDYAMSRLSSVRYMRKTRLDDLFKDIDLLLSPTIAHRAFVCGKERLSVYQYVLYTNIWNAAGYCSASVPAGFYKGMPVGLQIVGRPGEEALVLRAARAFERERPWAKFRPDVG